uniref:Leucine-rich repeat and WD repeat-containing protein 1 n=1 Tax=Takifugu rubripes TaxID=31033 RepID=A0A674N4T4_TAKRU
MEKITEKLLLEKSSPKTSKLEQIKSLNLSGLNLKLQDLPICLLSRLRSLERWDLSRNQLQELPQNLDLPALQFLDLSDNQLEDITSLESLQHLEELKMEDNLYITISDHYKLMVLLPRLMMLNSKNVSSTASHVRYVYTENLRARIIAVWEKNFSLPDPITAEKMLSLETNFVNMTRQQVKFGPSSVSDFTKWRVKTFRVSGSCFGCFCLPPVSLKPLHVLQCHSKLDSCDDFSTQLWSCSFQPQEGSELSVFSGGLVATCGGDTLCLIDCDSGMVMKKYKVAGEEFFSLAWSTVLMSRGDQDSAQLCSILAAGGKRGLVKLIHPRENFAYGEFRASRKSLSVLRFHERQGNFLFTGAYDNRIVMWDVGGVDSHYNFKVNQLLVMQISSTPLHICLPAASSLLCGSDDGLFYFNTQPSSSNAKSRCMEMEITFPVYKNKDKDHDYRTIDGLSLLTDDIIASKNFQYNCIYLWSWGRTAAQRPDKKNRLVSAVVLAELQWTNTDVPYLSLSTCPDQAYIVCGDDEGRLWTYDMSNLQNILRDKPAKPLQPTKILEWPGPVRKGSGPMKGPSINTVAADPELRYVVALSDQNMVIVWKRAETDGSS